MGGVLMSAEIFAQIDRYPLLAALKQRRSRRFGLGMKMPSGPMAYESRHAPFPLTEDEEACLTFAASGITGFALLDLPFSQEQGGAIVARSLGRTFASGDAIQTVALVIVNDDATYLIKRPQDFAATEIQPLIDLASQNEFTEIYRRMRVKIKDGRVAASGADVQRQCQPLVALRARHNIFFADQRTDFHVHQRFA